MFASSQSKYIELSPCLAEQVFQCGRKVGFFVAVFDDDGGVDAEAQVFAGAVLDGSAAGYDYGAGGDDEGGFGSVGAVAVDGVVGEVVDGGAAGEDDSGGEDGAGLRTMVPS
jgi:hypothetical protein